MPTAASPHPRLRAAGAAAGPPERPLPLLWGYRGFWQIRLRWAVAPLMALSALAGRALGFEFATGPILAIAVASPLYNGLFALLYARLRERIERDRTLDVLLTGLQVVADYAAMLLLIHYTGGSRSPLAAFLIFHVIIAAVQFRPPLAYLFAAWAAGGLWAMLLADAHGVLAPVEIRFRGESVVGDASVPALAMALSFFTLTLFVSALLVDRIMREARGRADALAETSARLERAMYERTQFMLQAAHNLRSPVGAALGQLDLLRSGYSGELSDEQDARLGRVEERLHGLDATIAELLAIAQARDWTREIADVVIDLNELALYTDRSFAAAASRSGIAFEVMADHGLPLLPSGGDLLERMIDNLVSNAIKYTPAGGRVRVAFLRRDEHAVRIMVEDSGIGIPATEQQRLFEEFFRASNARRHTPRGSGLGLSYVRECVERHGGRIFLASDDRSGTTVVVDLPLERPPLSELTPGTVRHTTG